MTVLFRPALFILFAFFLLSACKPGDRPQEKRTRFLMGTLVEISIPGPATARTEEASNLAFAEMARLEQMMSTHRPDSELSRVNDNAGGSFTPVSPELIEVVRRGLEWGERSQGALAMSLGPVVDLWHFDGESGPPPAGESLAQALTRVDESGIEIREQEIRLKRPGMKLDLGAIAKGFAVDRAIGVLASRGVKNALVNAGGDLSVLGRPSAEKAWRVGLQHPRKPEALVAAFDAEGIAVATSGDYQRYFLHEDVRYHHLLVPATGLPSRKLISATLVAKNAADADALATAVFVLGREKGLELIESLKNVEGMVIDASGEVGFSTGFKKLPGFEFRGYP